MTIEKVFCARSKWSLVVSHGLMGTAMLATGLATEFWAVAATQMLWGLSWTFASGAEVAWVTDELARPEAMPAVLVRSGRAQPSGAATGVVGLGLLATLTERRATMLLAGVAMLLLGLYACCGSARSASCRPPRAAGRRWGHLPGPPGPGGGRFCAAASRWCGAAGRCC
ncbi:hypothetical protein [Streptomyces sp. B6B3]|uniref:hypothetical protein n=1 Tax=Streptomyces sp. B6B3 TaxID=3153570 RepID=UPI00325EE54E